MAESITVDYAELAFSICELESMNKGTGYARYSTSELINLSSGKMFQSVNQLSKDLNIIEDALSRLVNETIAALKNAGISFEDAEAFAVQYFSDIATQMIAGSGG